MQPSNLNKLKQAAALGLDPKLTKAHLPKFPAVCHFVAYTAQHLLYARMRGLEAAMKAGC